MQRLHAAAYPHLFKEVRDDRPVAEWFTSRLANPTFQVLIGMVAEEAIGYIAGNIRHYPENPFRFPLTIGIVDQLAVESGARGRGYGGQLLDALLAQCRASGVERIELSVWAFNTGAREFYLRRGFTAAQETMALEWPTT